MVISDINPSFDSDQVPGTAFGTFSGDLTGLDVSTLGQTIWNNETEATNIFIGHSLANTPQYDGAPSAKTVNSFGNIRGLSPEEPTKQGSYYAASVAYFGNKTKVTSPVAMPTNGTKQNVQTFAVALASPLPRIEIPISALNKTVTFVPFAKSVGGLSISATQGAFQPTNQIVDFYIDKIRNVTGFPTDATVNSGRPYYKFLINFEDVEQGADHDMDAIAEYTIFLNADNTIQVKVESTYASGSIIQHIGYVVSGSTADGTYLVVRDSDTDAGSDPDYFLDKPYEYPATNIALPLSNSRTFTAGANPSAAFLKHDPLWYAAKWGGFTDLSTSKDDLPNQTSEWDKKAADGTIGQDGNPDNYFLVTNAGKLKDQLRSAFAEISERVTSASAVAQNSTRLDTDSMIFQARFNTQDWTGQLRALKISTGDGAVDTSNPVWEASEKMPAHALRKIYTWDPVQYGGNKFEVLSTSGGLTAGQLTTLNLGGATTFAEQEKAVNYLRGDATYEQKNGGILRNRSSRLGDIINTDPIYVYAEDFGYEALSESQPVTAGDPNLYATYRDTTKPLRRKMIYVSSNDGIVHGFDGSDNASSGGVEQFGFVPNAALAKMKGLAQPSYAHEYIVDGPLFAGDAFINSAWKTVLLGTTGAAANKAIFALDITNPDTFDASKVMWEFSHAELGYPLGQPVIARMPNGRWAAVFGNGVESTSGTAKLFIVYLDPVLGATSPGWTANTDFCVLEPNNAVTSNGLSSPALLDTDGNGIVDYIYAGDLQGNLWKFKIDSTGQGSTDNCPTGKWQVDKKVFQTQNQTCKTRDSSGTVSNCTSPTTKRQPINSQIEISANQTGQTGGYMLFFGTGSYYQNSDVNDMTTQSFYSIWDDGGNSTVPLSDLVKQTIDSQGTLTVNDESNLPNTLSYDYRVTSSNAVTYPTKKGWYLDLLKPNPTAATPVYQGERIVSSPLLRAGRVVFTTLIPSTDTCSFGGDSWIMEVELASGKATSTPVFDLNNDGGFSSADKSGSNIVSGIKSSEGIIKTPAIISAGGTEYKISSGTTGNIVKITEKGTVAVKRTSWRQLQ
jgi:type IV pilus assembly protein PilY1